jgi:hypothetical protein
VIGDFQPDFCQKGKFRAVLRIQPIGHRKERMQWSHSTLAAHLTSPKPGKWLTVF